jgi:hypothetical protein
MTRLKPIGLSKEDQRNPVESIVPVRVQKLIDLYKKNHYQYLGHTRTKTNRFSIIEYRRPNTYRYRVGF